MKRCCAIPPIKTTQRAALPDLLHIMQKLVNSKCVLEEAQCGGCQIKSVVGNHHCHCLDIGQDTKCSKVKVKDRFGSKHSLLY